MTILAMDSETAALLKDHVVRWRDCHLCPLGDVSACRVLGRGTAPADVLYVGEAPGSSEDATGIPFIGPSGKVLDEWIAKIELRRPGTSSFVTNIVSCHPSEGGETRPPAAKEIETCRTRLVELLPIVRPRVIVAVGSVSAAVRFEGYECVAVRHPSYLLRNKSRYAIESARAVATVCETLRRLDEEKL